MEKVLKLNATEDTPKVVLNKARNEFSLNGRSLPEDAPAFYKPVISWMENYVKNPNPYTELRIALDYFNSSSIKQILVMFMLLEDLIKSGKEAKVVWCYNEDDELMEIKGREFKSMLNIPFELVIVRT
ncbi:MAG: DUF1987 domain-containing protein [Bacteroidota bacterium]